LLEPTKIYVKSLLELIKTVPVHALAHITGGGLTENLPRVLPENLNASINLSAWEFPETFKWLQQQGNVSQTDMLTTFNCGIGMIVCVDASNEAETLAILEKQGESAFTVGEIINASGNPEVVYIK
ncbi:MAG: phosphoribosylformylglycinamidine cyclo-ligase, partial [Gammaproteobacteria bacterium]